MAPSNCNEGLDKNEEEKGEAAKIHIEDAIPARASGTSRKRICCNGFVPFVVPVLVFIAILCIVIAVVYFNMNNHVDNSMSRIYEGNAVKVKNTKFDKKWF